MASTLGSVVIELAVNLAKFRTEMAEGAKISQTRLREIQRHVAQTEKRFEQMGNGVRRAFYAIGAGLLFREIVRATAESEDAIAQLNATLKSTGGAVGFSSEALQKMAEDLQRVTTYGDDAIIRMQSVLATFTSIRGDQFTGATEAVLDLATKLRTDLQSAAVQVGKALQDPIRGITALRRVGVNFSDAQVKVIKSLVDTGQAIEAQKLILKELQVEFGGSARAARETFGGALAGIKNAAGDLLEVKTGAAEATKALNDFASVLADPGVKSAADTLFSSIIIGASKTVKALSDIVMGIQVLTRTINQNKSVEIDLEIEDIEGKIRRMEGLWDVFLPDAVVKKRIEAYRQDIGLLMQQQRQLLRLGEFSNLPPDKPKPAAEGTDPAVPDPADPAALAAARKAYDERLKAAQDYYKGLVDAALKATDALRTPTDKLFESYDDGVLAIRQLAAEFPALSDWAEEQITLFQKWGQTQLDGIAAGSEAVKARNKLIEEGKALTEAMRTPVELWAAEVQRITDLYRALEGTKDAISPETLSRAVQKLGEELTQTANAMTVFAEQAGRNMQDALARYLFDPFKSGLDGMLSGFVDTIRSMVANLAAQQLLTAFFTWGSGLGGSIGGFASSMLKGITGKATGGPVMAGGTYLVGERGPELLRMGGASGAIVPNHALAGGGVNINYSIDARGADADRILSIMPGLLRQTEQRTISQVRDLIARGRLA